MVLRPCSCIFMRMKLVSSNIYSLNSLSFPDIKMAEKAALKAVADTLFSLVRTELGLAWGVKTEISKLSSAVSTIRAVIEDAELKQIKNTAIKEWVIKLKHAAYDTQDVFADLAIDEPELLRPDDPTGEGCFNWVCVSLRSLCINLKRLMPHYTIAKKIKPIRERFDRIVKEMADFNLINGVVDGEGLPIVPHHSISEDRKTSSKSAEPHIYGRDADKEKIVAMLLDNAATGEPGISVCPIIGVGGVGKTTLTQFVFNDDRVEKHFDVRIWICVSGDFVVKNLLKKIMEFITKKRFDHDDEDVIRDCVVEQLKGKRFLLVLDDVWSDRQDIWNMLKSSLISGTIGNSIIVTTRRQTVASITKTKSEPYQLNVLTDDDCWSLFKSYASDTRKELDKPSLVNIGKEIVKKCGGLPLAGKALGSMLRFKVKKRHWTEVRDSEIWDLERGEGNQGPQILPALLLSYYNLSSPARQCFAYCSLFPKHYEMSKDELVFLWLGNGLLEVEHKKPEDVGDDVFIELKLHSFFQDVKVNVEIKNITFTIHDLLHDLASSMMKMEHKNCEVEVREVRNKLNYGVIQHHEIRLRHMSITLLPSSPPSLEDDSSIHPSNSSQQFPLRTLLLFSSGRLKLSAQDVSAFSYLKNLRVLWIVGWSLEIESLPVSFGDKLRHLIYLNLSGCGLSSLPAEFFRGMKNLQILDLSWNGSLSTLPTLMGNYLEHLEHLSLSRCNLTQFPDPIGNLERLRHLNLSNNNNLVILSESLGNLTKLETLNVSGCFKLKELPQSTNRLCNLRELDTLGCWELTGMPSMEGQHLSRLEKLSFWVGDNIKDLQGLNLHGSLTVVIRAHLCSHPQMEVLSNKNNLSELWILLSSDVKGNFDKQMLRILKPPSNIEVLKIHEYGGERFPEWMEMRDPRSSFPRLKTIRLIYMMSLEEWRINWSDNECLPALHELIIDYCPRLKALPEELGNLTALTSLEIVNCEELASLPIGLQKLTSLETLIIRSCSELVWMPELQLMTSLKKLVIQLCPRLKFVLRGLGNLTALMSLEIESCEELVSVPIGLQKLTSLETLIVRRCSELVSMPQLQLMTSLKNLQIVQCSKLKFVFNGLRHLTSLQVLYIKECPGIVIQKGELDPLVALRGPYFHSVIDKELIIDEDEDSTISGTGGKQVQEPIHDHQEDYPQSMTISEINRIRKGKNVLQ